jgi:uncharacterized membrane protein YvlD (DUF360 family)
LKKLLLRWIANGLAFYLALYLVDSLVAPRVWIQKGWIAIILAVLLGFVNSLIRPLPRFKTKRNRALTVALLTVIGNALVLQILIWAGAPLSTANPGWVIIVAIFLTLLAMLLNWLVGFKKKEPPRVVTRELGVSGTARGRETGGRQPRS